jgi:iron complex outermembrane receptor protein
MPPMVVSVTRLPGPTTDSTADVTVLTQRDIQSSSAESLDDVLRAVPGFNTFRRSSSMVTAPADDPEAQGVTLRGIGPGGASRALVMLDGIPVNDAFGGWIYWDEIPLDSIERIEVVNGGGSNLWGNEAEGGLINIITKRPHGRGLQSRASYGNRNTTDDALTGNYEAGPFRVGLEGNFFNTAGWNIIAPAFRGPIDHNTSSIHELFSGRVDYDPGRALTAFLRGSYYRESLDLGTPFRSSSATRGFINGGGTLQTATAGRFSLSSYAHLSTFGENFSIVNTPRTAEIRSQSQRVPSTDVGGSLTWTRSWIAHNQLLAGGDFRLIDGKSEDGFFNAAGTAIDNVMVSSGQQNFFGMFVEDIYRPVENLEVDVSVRGDLFQNLHGRIRNNPSTAAATVMTFPDRTRTATSPKLAVRYAPWQWLTLRGSLYEAFRAPTLAELYRQSTVESLVLLPNPSLSPEFLEGGELGLQLNTGRGATLGLTGYWDILHKPISNVVTGSDPVTGQDTQRTRENLGRAQIRGYEANFDYDTYWINWHRWARYHPDLHLTVDYLRSEAKLTYNPPDPLLKGRRLALVPWNTGSGNVSYRDDLIGEISVQVMYQGMQWEDSDNRDRQPAYWLTNLTLARQLPEIPWARWLKNDKAYLKMQNLLNHSYVVDLGGGIPKTGTPFLVEGGLIVPITLR